MNSCDMIANRNNLANKGKGRMECSTEPKALTRQAATMLVHRHTHGGGDNVTQQHNDPTGYACTMVQI